MRIIENPARSAWDALTRRQGVDYEGIRPRVEAILRAVETEGDAALQRLMREIDKVDAPLEVTESEIDAACAKVSEAGRSRSAAWACTSPAAARRCSPPC